MVSIVQEAVWLDPQPHKKQDRRLREESAWCPSSADYLGGSLGGVVAPLNVTYCLQGGFRKCQAPIKQSCSPGKTKKGLFIWDLFALIFFSYLLRLSSGVVFKTTSPPSQSEAGAHPWP